MKLGFAKKKGGGPKEDITRDKDRNPKGLLGGVAVTTLLLAGIATVSLKIKKAFDEKDE